ncbi:MAG TPA: hypothetical protein VLI41_02020 [Phenylobacterium sp.]|uniref:hypothetical protein n=1 Tax=Phenylobacterium sp. TaxID=1871053 RepID=UPI002C4E91C1|nr:hypothetical protein [Phenylobacterium sp.]HSV01957.1 hypothetical protein [Phenylobacterium sp.]
MANDQNRREAEALTALARALAASRPDMEPTLREIEGLAAAALGRPAPIEVERGFEQAARRLRTGWLRSVAAETARVLRSPTEREIERLAHSRHDAYGYERDFQPESLEARCEAFFGPAPPGWTAAHVMFSSGQAALATVLLHLGERRRGKLEVAHVGSYFETRELVARACAPARNATDADCIIVEPMACDGRFTRHDPARLARRLTRGQVLVVDETLSAPATQAPAILAEAVAGGAAVLRLVSGLKLLQQGLELANVGIVSVFATEADLAASLADGLKRCRTLTGAGLRFVDALALEAPFFLDREATETYAGRVFAHNAALAQAVMARNRRFKPLGGAGLAGAAMPYCAFELEAGNGVEGLEALACRIEDEATARGLLIERGGSFGFRGHRFEVIEPETGEPPFLRIALGARDDHSCSGLIELMGRLAQGGAEMRPRWRPAGGGLHPE